MKFLKIMLIVILAGVMGKTTYASNESKQLIDGFTNESKLGIVITTGNSKTLTFDAAQKDTYEWGHNKLGFLGTYLRSTSKGIESARRWSLGLRYDRAI
ncbi:MAG TPA: DUF481 domain-containing protein, partial [Oligoflexia bacterium]|nr:DUF481 domain-containing protein [Oligoflexia bacterium]